MNKDRLNLLENYIKADMSPLLITDISSSLFNHAVKIKATIDRTLLNGHYEGTEFCAPEWLLELIKMSKKNYVVLLIENINAIDVEEQTKFIEILKYKKVSTFALPENCFVVVTCLDLQKNKINEEVYSLLVHI